MIRALLALLVFATPVRAQPVAEAVLDVSPVWAGHPVGFCLLTHGDRQYVAYFDDQRRMTIASRLLAEDAWTKQLLPSSVKWDSHNYITMAVDSDGHLHASGNTHGDPLVYFRTTRAGDVSSIEQVKRMTGANEARCTYPRFLRGPKDELLFTYRDGGSGNGIEIYNIYDAGTRAWRRLLDRPLLDGEGDVSAYPVGPVRGPDGLFHLCWVWRDTPDAATNHTLSYARSADLLAWTKADGTPLELPLTRRNADVIDPVPAGGGLLNSNTRLSFDADRRPIVSYHKHDERGHTQIYNARFENGRWVLHQASDWDYRWEFGGGGTLGAAMSVGEVTLEPDGTLTQTYRHPTLGSGTWRLDPATLKAVGTANKPSVRPAALGEVESTFPGMQVKWSADIGTSREPNVTYWLRWETLPANRDKPRPEPWPEPSMLRVYKIRVPASSATTRRAPSR
jgi:hypothetical protein